MHMSDALVSPAVGGFFWIAAGVTTLVASKKLSAVEELREDHPKITPAPALMGTAGAFVFAAQMLNFSIPGTGSSGHLGGGLLLTVLLGPHAAFLTMASILSIQALFFGDGGLLALGCNIFNLGFIPAYLAWPLVFRAISPGIRPKKKVIPASVAASVFSLFLGASFVMAQTCFSGVSALGMSHFAMLMIPIHLAIGLVEGLATAGILRHFLTTAEHETNETADAPSARAIPRLAAAAVVTAGFLSWFASQDPDGLEWSLERAAHHSAAAAETSIHAGLSMIQEKTSLFPDYEFPAADTRPSAESEESGDQNKSWPSPNPETSTAGLTGAAMTMAAALLIGTLAGRASRRMAFESGK